MISPKIVFKIIMRFYIAFIKNMTWNNFWSRIYY